MTERLPPFPALDQEGPNALLTQLDALRTFAQVAEWDERAAQHVSAIRRYLQQLDALQPQVEAAEQAALASHSQQNIWRRIVGSSPDVKATQVWIAQATSARSAQQAVLDQLQAAMDKTPNTKEEQLEMLQELKLAKKELALQKREASEALRQIRSVAREKGSRVGTGLFSTATTRRVSRMRIRLQEGRRCQAA